MRGVLVLAGLLAALIAAPAQAQVSRTFGEWMVVCDNLKTCSAFGFSDQASEAWLKVSREAGPGTPVEVTLFVRPFDEKPGADGWTIRTGDRVVESNVRFQDDGDSLSLTLTGERAVSLVAAVRDGRDLTLDAPGRFKTDIVLTGSSAALRFIDNRQGRAGHSDAFAARGGISPDRAPAAPKPPFVRPAKQAQTGRPARDPAFIREISKHEDCDSLGDPTDFPTIWARLGSNLQLWGGICSSGAYNFSYKFFTADNAGKNVKELSFPYAPGSAEAETTYVTNPDFSPADMTLSAFEKGRGLGDCGAALHWVWNGRAFVLVEQSIMPDCRGVSPDHWPTLYQGEIEVVF